MKHRILSACLLFTLASGAQGDQSPASSPPPKPGSWPFFFQVDVCAAWAHARGEHSYYRECKDRPVATGKDDGVAWQLQVFQRYIPGGVMLLDMLPHTGRPLEDGYKIFDRYIQAAADVKGSRVAPLLDIVQPATDTAEKREEAAFQTFKKLLEKYRNDPRWLSVEGNPVIVDYAQGGIKFDGLEHVGKRLREAGLSHYWITDIGTPLSWTLTGKIDEEVMKRALACATGVYSFTAPVDDQDGGFALLRKRVQASSSPRAWGVTAAPGGYSCRLAQRNYVAARGTQDFRRSLDQVLSSNADFASAQTWNDYIEAAHVEPSYKHTSSQLEIMAHYAEIKQGRDHPKDTQPHIIISYRKSVFSGERHEIELLNLPLRDGFGVMSGTVTVSLPNGQVVATLPFQLQGDRLDAQTVSWMPPANLRNVLAEVQVEISQSKERPFQKHYRNLPSIPVITSSTLADPLTYSVPLHRLYTETPVALLVDGKSEEATTHAPHLLSTKTPEGLAVDGISYMRSGAVINDPTPATSTGTIIDNYPNDRTRPTALTDEYYGALLQFKNGTIAYAPGLWWHDPDAGRVYADYQFCGEPEYTDREPDTLQDRSGHKFNATLALSGSTGAKPTWTRIGHLYSALTFDGKGGVVKLPGVVAFPIGSSTIELAVNPDEVGRSQALLSEGGELINISLDPDGKIRARHTNTRRRFDDVVSKRALRPGEWAVIVATYDMSTLRLYIDGKEEGHVSTDGLRSNEGATLGAPFWREHDPRRGDIGLFKGRIARLRILDGASSESEIGNMSRQLLSLLKTSQ